MLGSVVVAASLLFPPVGAETPESAPFAPESTVRARAVAGGGSLEEQQQDPLHALRDGIRLVEQGDYPAAIEVLEAAAIELEADRAAPRDRAQSWFYAGVARLFVVGDEEALLAFQQAQNQDPQFRPAPTDFPRRVMRLWEEAATRSVDRTTRLTPSRREQLDVLLPSEPEARQERRAAAPAPTAFERQDEVQEESGGGGWWRWAAVAAGGGAAAYLLVPKNKPPVASASVAPTGAGMAGTTEYRFDGSGSSDPDNDQLTYSWNFGDGGGGSGRIATHVYDRPGSYIATLTVSDGKEQATTTRSVTVARNLDGGQFASPRLGVSGTTISIRVSMRLSQDGTRLRGSATFSGDVRGTLSVSGSLSSSNRFVCPCRVSLSGGSDLRLTGTVDNGANVIDGDFSFVVQTSQGRVRLRWDDISFSRQ